MRIDPKLLIDFATIAEEGSFTRAAHRLGVAQPWLSARLNKLEAMVGFPLLNRTTRSLSLTERGEDLLEVAQSIARNSESANRLASQLSRRSNNVLKVGAAPYTRVIRQRRELIEEFSCTWPAVNLELEIGWSLRLLDRLDEGLIDLSFQFGEIDSLRYEVITLNYYGVAMTLARGHALADEQSLSPEVVARYPIEVFTRSLYPKVWDTLYAPLIAAGADLVEVPDLAEGNGIKARSTNAIAAFIDFGADCVDTPDFVNIPLASDVAIPFQLVRVAGQLSKSSQQFWEVAYKRRWVPSGIGVEIT